MRLAKDELGTLKLITGELNKQAGAARSQVKAQEARERDFARSQERSQAGVLKRGEGAISGLNNILIGASFPLLTGQGLGGAVGGGLGGGIGAALGGGSGFGLSIAGSVVGAAFDNIKNAASAMADSLGAPTELLASMDAAGVKAGKGLRIPCRS